MFKRIVLILPTLLLISCGNIPETSSIKQGPEIGSNGQNSIIRVIASRPQPGMSQEQIVTGFLNASASSDNDFGIAREYLIPDKKLTWNPTKSIEVYEGQGQLQFINENQIDFTAALHSRIDETSRISLANPENQLLKTFNLVKIDDQWRIDINFDGLVISKTDLNRSFSVYPIWFMDPSRTFLVPESVILPRAITANATRLMQLLLLGPSQTFKDSVISGFPIGSALSIDSVPISNGIAMVSLNEAVLKAESIDREILAAQIVKTLTRIPEVNTIQIKVGTQNLNILNAPINQTALTWDKYYADANRNNSAYFISDNKLFKSTPEGLIQTNKSEIDSKNWSFGTSNRTETLFALLDESRTNLSIFAFEPSFRESSYNSSNFGDPKIDVFNTIWVMANNQPNVYSKDKKLNLIVQNFSLENILDVIPAPDGTRVLLIVRTVYGTELRIANVKRNLDSIVLTNIQKIMRDGFSISKASWQDETTVVYLDNSTQPVNIYNLDIFTGISRNIYTINGAQDLATSNRQPTLVEINDGTILQRVSGEWQTIPDAINPSYPH